jgi:hypothetical protein
MECGEYYLLGCLRHIAVQPFASMNMVNYHSMA